MRTKILAAMVLVAVVSGPVLAALVPGDAIIAGWTKCKTGKHSGTFGSALWYTTEGTPDPHDGGSGVVITPDKRVFLTNYTKRTVMELDEDANVVNSAFITYPTDVTLSPLLLDASNNLYAGCNDGKVRKYSPTGAYLGVYADIGAWVIADMAWGTAPGTMFISEVGYTGHVFKWDGAAASLFASVAYRGRGVAVSDGHVFVNNGNARDLLKYDEITGAQVGSAKYPEGIKPRGMTTGPDGRIYSALEYGPPAGLVIDLDLTEFLQFGGTRVANAGHIAFVPVPEPCTLALLAAGGVFVVRRRK